MLRPFVDRRGQVIAERYTLDKAIGGGGFGAVYEATDGHLNNRVVAVKMLRPDAQEHAEFVSRFRREMEAVARLQNPNIVQVSDYGETEDGELYLVMERLEGKTLREVLSEAGRLPLKRALRIGHQLSEALDSAHRANLLHRDIKPANIMVLGGEDAHRDFVKVLDFGISKDLSGEEEGLTERGAVVGSPRYMSPEQLYGTELTTASDVFVFSVVLYELLTGRHPFERATIGAVRRAIVAEDPAPLRDVAPDLAVSDEFEAALRDGLEKDPARRCASVRTLFESLQSSVGQRNEPIAYAATAEDLAAALGPKGLSGWWLPAVLGLVAVIFITANALQTSAPVDVSDAPTKPAAEVCESALTRVAAEVRALESELRASKPKRAAQRRQRDRLASRLSGAASMLSLEGDAQCKAGAGKLSEAWTERVWRIKLSVQGGRALLTSKGAKSRKVTADAVALVDVIIASADPNAALEPLVITDVVKRGGGGVGLSLKKLCGAGVCPEAAPTGQTFSLSGALSAPAHLYVMVYDDGGRFRVLEPTTSGRPARPAGPIILTAERPLMAHPGQSILAVASAEPIGVLEGLIGKMLRPKGGEMAQEARAALSQLALSAHKGAGPAQVLLRSP